MELSIIQRRPNRSDVCSANLVDDRDLPLVFYELETYPVLVSMDRTAIRRVRTPTTRKGTAPDEKETSVTIRWGILKATTLVYAGVKERLPVQVKEFLKRGKEKGVW